jgi:hypothetical protein
MNGRMKAVCVCSEEIEGREVVSMCMYKTSGVKVVTEGKIAGTHL